MKEKVIRAVRKNLRCTANGVAAHLLINWFGAGGEDQRQLVTNSEVAQMKYAWTRSAKPAIQNLWRAVEGILGRLHSLAIKMGYCFSKTNSISNHFTSIFDVILLWIQIQWVSSVSLSGALSRNESESSWIYIKHFQFDGKWNIKAASCHSVQYAVQAVLCHQRMCRAQCYQASVWMKLSRCLLLLSNNP